MPFAGHSVLINNLSECGKQAVRRVFADQPVAATCPRRGRELAELFARLFFPPTGLPPVSLADVRPARGVPGVTGRTLSAVALALEDFGHQLIYSFDALLSGTFDGIGGLRGGRFTPRGLDRYSYVPGVEVSSAAARRDRLQRGRDPSDLLLAHLRLRVTGRAAARGSIVFDLSKGTVRTTRQSAGSLEARLSAASDRRGCAAIGRGPALLPLYPLSQWQQRLAPKPLRLRPQSA